MLIIEHLLSLFIEKELLRIHFSFEFVALGMNYLLTLAIVWHCQFFFTISSALTFYRNNLFFVMRLKYFFVVEFSFFNEVNN